MQPNWRTKAYLLLSLVIFSVYLVIPTVFDFRSMREDAEAKGDEPPWYVKLFPDKQINLGLDLQGGIYFGIGSESPGGVGATGPNHRGRN
jgi:preprotein translocase subunit SecD